MEKINWIKKWKIDCENSLKLKKLSKFQVKFNHNQISDHLKIINCEILKNKIKTKKLYHHWKLTKSNKVKV